MNAYSKINKNWSPQPGSTLKKNLITEEPMEDLQEARVVQHDLVYIIGLSPRIASYTVIYSLYRSFLSLSIWVSMGKYARWL